MVLGIEASSFNTRMAEFLVPAAGVRTFASGISLLLLSFKGYRRMSGLYLAMEFLTQGVDAYVCYMCGGNWKGHLILTPLTMGYGV